VLSQRNGTGELVFLGGNIIFIINFLKFLFLFVSLAVALVVSCRRVARQSGKS
jgi:hypothetical protein